MYINTDRWNIKKKKKRSDDPMCKAETETQT